MYESKKFVQLKDLKLFTEKTLENHLKLYEGYVNNTNKLLDLMPQKEAKSPELAELNRRFSWEFNGMRLHELFFANLTPDFKPLEVKSKLAKKITEDFGSIEKWQADFSDHAAMRGIGWVALIYDQVGDRLFNVWINEHNVGVLAEGKILLILDVFEHAYFLDYQTNRADYIKNFFEAIDWKVADERFEV